MATHSSIFAWRIPWTEEPGGLQSIGSQRVRHDWVTKHTHNTHLILIVVGDSLPVVPQLYFLPFWDLQDDSKPAAPSFQKAVGYAIYGYTIFPFFNKALLINTWFFSPKPLKFKKCCSFFFFGGGLAFFVCLGKILYMSNYNRSINS